MSRRSIGPVIFLAALFGLLTLSGGRAQDRPAKAKRMAYGVKYGNARELASALAKHFKEDADVQAIPTSNFLLVRAEPAVIEEVTKLLALLDRRPRMVTVELFIVEVPPRAAALGKGLDETELKGVVKNVVERLEAQRAKGTISGLRRIRLATLENQPSTASIGESIPYVTRVTAGGRGGVISRLINYRNIGTRAKVLAHMPDEKTVTVDLEVEHSRMHVPADGVVAGKDEEGKLVVVPEWPTHSLKTRVSIPLGRVVLAEQERRLSKPGQARTLILVTAQVTEEGAGGGK